MLNQLNKFRLWTRKHASKINKGLFVLAPIAVQTTAIIEKDNVEQTAAFENATFMAVWATIENIAAFEKVRNLPVDKQQVIPSQMIKQLYQTGTVVVTLTVANTFHLVMLLSDQFEKNPAQLGMSMVGIEALFGFSLKFLNQCQAILTIANKSSPLLENTGVQKRRIFNPYPDIAQTTMLLAALPTIMITSENKSAFIPTLLTAMLSIYEYLRVSATAHLTIDKLPALALQKHKTALKEGLFTLYSAGVLALAITYLSKLMDKGELSRFDEQMQLALGELELVMGEGLIGYYKAMSHHTNFSQTTQSSHTRSITSALSHDTKNGLSTHNTIPSKQVENIDNQSNITKSGLYSFNTLDSNTDPQERTLEIEMEAQQQTGLH